MNRGSRGRRPLLSSHAPTRFNEAPIHESGKSFRPADSLALSARFNEAPIHESGK